MKFSLVISTLGRMQDLENLFRSLELQEEKDFEVIVVDQNQDLGLTTILNMSWSFSVKHIHCPGEKGASHGRNKGVESAEGDLVIFPDDDCWYPSWFLSRAKTLMNDNHCDVLVGRAAEEATGRSINGRFSRSSSWVNRSNVFKTQIEWVACYKRDIFVALKGFDDGIGVGASSPWQSSEGPELTLRAIELGCRIYYSYDFYGFHKELDTISPSISMISKGRAYARGYGYVMVKHNYRFLEKLMILVKPVYTLLKSIFHLNWRATKYNANVILGRYEGLSGNILN